MTVLEDSSIMSGGNRNSGGGWEIGLRSRTGHMEQEANDLNLQQHLKF